MKCEYDDCLTCPYHDCISDNGPQRPKGKKGPTPLPPGIYAEHQREYARKHYQEIKSDPILNKKRQEYMRKYYKDHAEKIRVQQHEYRQRGLLVPSPLLNIWVTDGRTNKRIKLNELDEWKAKGWMRGRTMKHD